MEISLLVRQLLFEEAPPLCDPSGYGRSLRQAGQIILAGITLGLAYPVFGDGFGSVVPFINGLFIGLLGAAGISIMELYLSRFLRKKLSFLLMVVVKISLYTGQMVCCVLGVIVVSRSIQSGQSVLQTLHSDGFRRFIVHEDFVIIVVYALVFVTLVIFTMEMSRKMGQGVLFNFITGRFFKPTKEHRVFMFLDVNSSVTLAEKMGDLEYHNLITDFVRDITPGIIASKGKIHQYVGDEVVVSWLFDRNNQTDQFLLAFLYSFHLIRARRSYYTARYGLVPGFKGAFHCGDVISGEVGEIKSEIVFHGDTVNTTARIERLCNELGESMLISQPRFEGLSLSTRDMFRFCGSVRLRGKNREMQVYGPIPGTLLTSSASSTLSAKRIVPFCSFGRNTRYPVTPLLQ